MKIQLILETFQVKWPPNILRPLHTTPHTHLHTHTQSVGNGFSQAGNPMLNVLPVDDAHAKGKRAPSPVSWALFVQAASNDMSNTQLLRFGQPLPLPLLLLPSLCCLSVGEYWLLLWTEKLSADLPQLTVPMTLCPDHRRQKLWHPKCPKWYAIFMLFFSFGFFLFAIFLSSV